VAPTSSPQFEIFMQPLEVLLNAVALDDATPDYASLAAVGWTRTGDGRVYCHGMWRGASRQRMAVIHGD
jgi:hypothetical protein